MDEYGYFVYVRDYYERLGKKVPGKKKFFNCYKKVYIDKGRLETLVEKAILTYMLQYSGGVFVMKEGLVFVTDEGVVKEIRLRNCLNTPYCRGLVGRLTSEVAKAYSLDSENLARRIGEFYLKKCKGRKSIEDFFEGEYEG